MLKFICKEVRTCPEGAKTGQEMMTFTDVKEMEKWLRDDDNYGGYVARSLVGCEKLDKTKAPTKKIPPCVIGGTNVGELFVKLSWDGKELGPKWMNEDNLKALLFSGITTKPELLQVEITGWSDSDKPEPKKC
jgi:hypothetical protein